MQPAPFLPNDHDPYQMLTLDTSVLAPGHFAYCLLCKRCLQNAQITPPKHSYAHISSSVQPKTITKKNHTRTHEHADANPFCE